MKAKLEEAILGSIGARQEMVRRSRGQLGGGTCSYMHAQIPVDQQRTNAKNLEILN